AGCGAGEGDATGWSPPMASVGTPAKAHHTSHCSWDKGDGEPVTNRYHPSHISECDVPQDFKKASRLSPRASGAAAISSRPQNGRWASMGGRKLLACGDHLVSNRRANSN